MTSPPVLPARGRAINALSDNFVHTRNVLLALLTSINRAQSAAQQGDRAARRAQLHAASRFSRQMAALVARRPGLRRRVARALRGILVLSARGSREPHGTSAAAAFRVT